jgi:DNA-binding response OmpR family regulator
MKKILIIEDDPVVGHIYRTRLEQEGYCVETCTDGQSGFYRIHEFHPDGVLLDLMLPKMNGIDILKKIRAQTNLARVPIVVFTNAYVPNMIQEALSAGASYVFNKAALTPRQILDALQNLFEGRGPDANSSIAPSAETPPAQADCNAPATAPSNPLGPVTETTFHTHAPGNPNQGSPPPPQRYILTEALRAPAPPEPKFAPVVDPEDGAFQSELSQSFLAAKTETLNTLRKLLHDFTRAPNEPSREPHLYELYRKVHALTGSAGIAGLNGISQMTAAVEVLLKDLHEKPKNINASTLRTVAHAIDFIGELFNASPATMLALPPATILVVDDEILSRRAITYALDKANLKSTSVEDPTVALKLATENLYHAIFLDVQMPGMDGFELCTRIRALPHHKSTPIIFVTSLTDFKSRAKSSLSGGTDLIAKPFMFIELTVKALCHVLRNELLVKKQAA